MIKQSLAFDGILEKKFKILRTSIMLGNLKNREDAYKEFENTAREVDKIKGNIYEELLASKMYTTITLEEEETRLKDLIAFIENRIKERNDFLDDYIRITSNFLDGLDKISLEGELDHYKERYNNIEEYLVNCENIKKYNKKLQQLRDELEEKYENKANNELINSKLEEELIDEFNKFISSDKYYSGLNYTDIELELTKLDDSLVEKKDVLNTFNSSYQALVSAGISGAEREEYSSYVDDAKRSYYEDIEKKCVLNIYKLVLDKQIDYDKLYQKRENISHVLDEREEKRKELGILDRDRLEYFVNLCKEQFSIIKSQKFNMENIDKLILDIADCENKLEDLEKANNRSEILDLLKEFSVESPEIEKVEMPDEKHVFEEVEKTQEKKPANMVVRVKDPIKINVKNVTDTAKLVMKKVVIVLEPKRFNNKNDKLKEVELELEKKKMEKSSALDNDASVNKTDDLFEDIPVNQEKSPVDSEDDSIASEFIPDTSSVDTVFPNDDSTIKNDMAHAIFKDIPVDSSIEVPEIEINVVGAAEEEPVSTEILIEEPLKEDSKNEQDLFKITDPFLDDNQFEIEEKDTTNSEVISNMPKVDNIGTVKPTNALSEIENVVRDNQDIILPNLGLVDNKEAEVPIVSENYINS